MICNFHPMRFKIKNCCKILNHNYQLIAKMKNRFCLNLRQSIRLDQAYFKKSKIKKEIIKLKKKKLKWQ